MNTCGTCKHRGRELDCWKPSYDENQNYIDSEKVKLTYFLCERIKMSEVIIADEEDFPTSYEPPGKKAVVTDGSGYYAALCVEDDFGCNLWESSTNT